ncbi:NADH-quinone oxidoreductase subunit C [Pontibacter rugosus]|uniref:NADH-quinone oxidoreductase subunit C n=1 Tax=Pontibacter rugosus TaxID=1745966 RepID=A0ABW3SW34_9BACT
MDLEEIKDLLVQQLGSALILAEKGDSLQPYLAIQPEYLQAVCLVLHDHELTYFDFLSCVTGLDNGAEAGTMEVAYTLYSIPHDHHLTLKVQVPRNTTAAQDKPQIPTVSHIWRTADWHEREVYDMFGIHFEGHPDMRRILCAADWEGHPLRKDYKLQEYYHGIKVPFDQHNELNGFKGEPQWMVGQPTPFSDKREKLE